jgi:hypothetical protein
MLCWGLLPLLLLLRRLLRLLTGPEQHGAR